MFVSLKISGSGLSAFRRKMNVAAENMANAETTKTETGGPYERKAVRISSQSTPVNFSQELNQASTTLTRTSAGHLPTRSVQRYGSSEAFKAQAEEVTVPNQKFRMEYDPAHPDADEQGFVKMPDIDPLKEMVEMMTASRAYEANVTAVKSVQNMVQKALDI
ncbi:MAG: flagellar basal body rod protein FlgC [bacterium]